MTPEKNRYAEELKKLNNIPSNTPGLGLIERFIKQGCGFEQAIEKAVDSWREELKPLEKQRIEIDSQIKSALTEGRKIVVSEIDSLKSSNNKVKQADPDYYKLQEKITFWLGFNAFTK